MRTKNKRREAAQRNKQVLIKFIENKWKVTAERKFPTKNRRANGKMR